MLYVPLKALSNTPGDLEEPLREIADLANRGSGAPSIRTAVRTGTPRRASVARRQTSAALLFPTPDRSIRYQRIWTRALADLRTLSSLYSAVARYSGALTWLFTDASSPVW